MEYQATANRRRPQSFQDLVGQEFVRQALENALNSQRIAPAYLFSGPHGVGKTSAARILARSLNCVKGPASSPCGACPNCLNLLSGKAIDTIEIDGASHTGVDDIREIKDEVLYPPSSARYKIFIIDEVHMLSNNAFNALLKTVEEPPEYIIFIFATTEVHKLPMTVRSRCQHYYFKFLPLELIKSKLEEACLETSIRYEPEALAWIARQSKGSMRDAYTLFDQIVSFCEEQLLSLTLIQDKMGLVALDQLKLLIEALHSGSMDRALERFREIIASGTSLETFLADLSDYLRSLLLLQSGLRDEKLQFLLAYPAEHYRSETGKLWNPEQLCHILERCFQVYRNLRYSLNPDFETELLLFELGELKSFCSSRTQLTQLESLIQQLQGGGILSLDRSAQPADAEFSQTIGSEKKKTSPLSRAGSFKREAGLPAA